MLLGLVETAAMRPCFAKKILGHDNSYLLAAIDRRILATLVLIATIYLPFYHSTISATILAPCSCEGGPFLSRQWYAEP
jgi:hypothetical protein